jgi:RNA recognition motif-containing protein
MRRYLSHSRYVFRPEDELGKSHKPLSINVFKAQGVDFEIITDRYTGQSRGFGFVEMPDTRAAQSAIQGLQGKALGGRTLNVNEAKPREPRREPRQARW